GHAGEETRAPPRGVSPPPPQMRCRLILDEQRLPELGLLHSGPPDRMWWRPHYLTLASSAASAGIGSRELEARQAPLLPPRARRRNDAVHPQIDDELTVVVADLEQRALPERGAGDRAVAERELDGLEELGVRQRP